MAEISDTILTYYIKGICNNILVHCNRSYFPEALKYVVKDMTMDKYLQWKGDNSDELSAIQSISESDKSVSYGISNSLQSKLNLLAQQELKSRYNLIDKYKLLYRTNKGIIPDDAISNEMIAEILAEVKFELGLNEQQEPSQEESNNSEVESNEQT